MKKITGLLLICFMSFVVGANTAFAEETQKIYTLSLAESVNMALFENPELKVLEITRVSNDINLDAAKLNQRKYKDAPISASALDIMYVKKGYYVSMYEMLNRLNLKETEQVKKKLEYDVTESYYNLKIATELVKTTEDTVKLAEENYKNVFARYELGMISKLDLDNASLSVETTNNALEMYKRNLEIAKENFRIKIGKDKEDCEFVLTDTIECPEEEYELSKNISDAMETRYDITALKENYEMAKLYFSYTEFLSASSANYHTAYSDLVSKEHTYNNTKKLISLSIKNSYNEILNAKDSLSLSEKALKLAKQRYETNKIKFECGMITNAELTASLNDYMKESINLDNAKLKYKLSNEKYKAEISIGL